MVLSNSLKTTPETIRISKMDSKCKEWHLNNSKLISKANSNNRWCWWAKIHRTVIQCKTLWPKVTRKTTKKVDIVHSLRLELGRIIIQTYMHRFHWSLSPHKILLSTSRIWWTSQQHIVIHITINLVHRMAHLYKCYSKEEAIRDCLRLNRVILRGTNLACLKKHLKWKERLHREEWF